MRKFDVAISVAEDDTAVADLIAEQLERLRVQYYYYKEEKGNWGKHLMDLTMDVYGSQTKYVLLITSERCVNRYWSGVERKIALAKLPVGNVLQLRLDDTEIEGLSEHIVYEDWRSNPEEIARLLKEKVMMRRRVARGRLLRIFSLLGIMTMALVLWYFVDMWWIHKDDLSYSYVKVNVGGKAFFISNVEVTVAAYREYCMLTHKVFPEQPFNSVDSMPVRNVTWEEAKAYCGYVKGRLPNELEWETAAVAGGSTVYSGGTSAAAVAVYRRVKPCFVGHRLANGYGIYDMSGNVAEWCEDWADSARTMKVVKGGGYDSEVGELAVKSRRAERPEARLRDVGFRVVKDQPY